MEWKLIKAGKLPKDLSLKGTCNVCKCEVVVERRFMPEIQKKNGELKTVCVTEGCWGTITYTP